MRKHEAHLRPKRTQHHAAANSEFALSLPPILWKIKLFLGHQDRPHNGEKRNETHGKGAASVVSPANKAVAPTVPSR